MVSRTHDIPAQPRHTRIARILIILVTIATFAPVMRHDFGGWDDDHNLASNAQMNPPTLESLKRFWTAPKFDLYVPVTWTVWWVLARVGYLPEAPTPDAHLNPYIFHSTNLALHVVSSLLAFAVLRRLLHRDAIAAATIGALVFAVHPVQVEPVAWVSGLKDVLSGLFALAAIALYLDATRDAKLRAPTYALATFMFVLALLSKPSAVPVPAMVIAIDWLVRGTPLKEAIKRFAPALIVALAWALIARRVQPATQVESIALIKRPLIAADAITFYLWKIVWPASLAVDYSRWPSRVLSSGAVRWVWIAPTLLVITSALAYRSARARAIIAAGLIFVIGISPMLGFLTFDFQAYSTVADHYLYLPMIGVALLIGWIVTQTRRAIVPAVIVIAIFTVLSFRQSLTWHDARSIAEHTMAVNPNSFAWGERLSRMLLQDGQLDRALECADRAVASRPDFTLGWITRGEILAAQKRFDQAADSFREAVKHSPRETRAHLGLANALADLGQPRQAIDAYRAALEINPNDVTALSNLAATLAGDGQLDEAIQLYRRAVEIDPNFEPARIGLSRALAERQPATLPK